MLRPTIPGGMTRNGFDRDLEFAETAIHEVRTQLQVHSFCQGQDGGDGTEGTGGRGLPEGAEPGGWYGKRAYPRAFQKGRDLEVSTGMWGKDKQDKGEQG